MRRLLLSLILIVPCSLHATGSPNGEQDVEEWGRKLLERVKSGKRTKPIQEKLAALSPKTLEQKLDTDDKKLAFWLNVYNAYIQILLQKEPSLYEDRDAFFGKDRVPIAGKKLSFDFIEHGLMRRSKVKAGMGHIQKPFPSDLEKRLRVEQLDPRIHFALNCGAKSCPPVAVYHSEHLDRELDRMAAYFLERTTELEGEKVRVTRLFSWFRGDFGGKDGMRDMLRNYDIIGQGAEPDIVFKAYDWTLDLGNYKEWGSLKDG
jgi:hypothetical protein